MVIRESAMGLCEGFKVIQTFQNKLLRNIFSVPRYVGNKIIRGHLNILRLKEAIRKVTPKHEDRRKKAIFNIQ